MQSSIPSAHTSSKTRNISLDLVKVIASFSVVCIHYMFSGEVGVIIKAVARFAVPFFFVISGFFAYYDNSTKMLKKAFNIAKIYIYSFLLYFVYGAARELLLGRASGVAEYVCTYLRASTILNFLIHNTTISAAHLWFLPALVYCYLVFCGIKKSKLSDNILFIISASLLVVRLLIGEVLGFLGIVEMNTNYFPNFIFVGLPFFALGMFVRKYQSHLGRFSITALILMLGIGVLETIVSVHFFKPHMLYLGTPLIVFSLVLIALKYGDKKYSEVVNAFSQLSTCIYIFHVAIGGTIETVISRATNWGNSLLWTNIKPFVVFVLAVVFSLIFKTLVNTLKRKRCIGKASV